MSLLEVADLRVSYFAKRKELKAVNGVSFKLDQAETLGLVGESGSGKTTLGLALANLIASPGKVMSGSVKLDGREVLGLRAEELRQVRGKEISMVFQDPTTSLNPVSRIGEHFVEAIRAHSQETGRTQALERAKEVLTELGISSDKLQAYPHQLSGGLKQRIMIGLALVLNPKVLIADEPTTSLDVIIEAQILDLIAMLRSRTKLSMLLITHNLGVVAEVADRIAIMYAGEIMELTDTRTLFQDPLFPYTQLLLQLVPNLSADTASLRWIPGSPPDLGIPITGCPFASRCPSVFARCRQEAPALKEVKSGHFVACHLYTGDSS